MTEPKLTEPNNNVIERIKRLLNLGRSPNPHEAEAAVAKAAKLMDDYRISMRDIREADSEITSVVFGVARIVVEHRSIANLLEEYFNVILLYRTIGVRQRITIYGKQDDVGIALQVYKTLLAEFKHRWKIHKQQINSRDSFMRGVKCGVEDQLKRHRNERPVAEQNALVVIKGTAKKAVYDSLEQRGEKIREGKKIKFNPLDDVSFHTGIVEGRTIQIYSQIRQER